MKPHTPQTIDDVQAQIRSVSGLVPCGGRTKPALLGPEGAVSLEMAAVSAVVDYEPSEFTISVQAGARLFDLGRLLAKNGQHLPFDPPLVDAGATIGGTVAAGLSGPGALGGGTVRDFVIGVSYVDGEGRLIRAGGRVVKNAAGFDLPKLMVGSLGRLGVLVEVSLKIFPRPPHHGTLTIECGGQAEAVDVLRRVYRSDLQVEALDLEPPGRLVVRLGGNRQALSSRTGRLAEVSGRSAQRMADEAASAYWGSVREFDWLPQGAGLVKVPLTAGGLVRLEHALAPVDAPRRYSLAGNVAWLAWPAEADLADLEKILNTQDLCGLVLRGDPARPRLNPRPGFGPRLKSAMDPARRFLEL